MFYNNECPRCVNASQYGTAIPILWYALNYHAAFRLDPRTFDERLLHIYKDKVQGWGMQECAYSADGYTVAILCRIEALHGDS